MRLNLKKTINVKGFATFPYSNTHYTIIYILTQTHTHTHTSRLRCRGNSKIEGNVWMENFFGREKGEEEGDRGV